MKIHYKIEFFGEWHCGSGLSAGADVDLLVVRDANKMPFVPGKTVKGLVSEAVDDYCKFSQQSIKKKDLFGVEGESRGSLFFSNATLEQSQYERIVDSNAQSFLYRSVASTAIDKDGIAKDHSLRKMEVVIPMQLEGDIICDGASDEDVAILQKSLGLIKRLGQNRNRGLGRCAFTLMKLDDDKVAVSKTNATGRLKFKCTLLSDIILNVKSASEGPNYTLDFIPGSNFLGIVAGKLYDSLTSEEQLELFHSGQVRFGDAHPLVENHRALRTPAAMFYPKLKKASEELYIHHLVPDLASEDMKNMQLKQCRSGFYAFQRKDGMLSKSSKSFAIKSAYDREKRRSADEKMYGYESLGKGLEMCFEVEVENENLKARIVDALVGVQRVGRSRSAQYGLVKIEACDYQESASSTKTSDVILEKVKKPCVIVYAESRLIFLDGNGQPTFQPSAEQLGVSGGKICWGKSQIRTFQYAPYNYKRKCFDTDRAGIEKGSVFIIEGGMAPSDSQYVGSYKNEGFGRVIYNPDFLKADEKGMAVVKLKDGVGLERLIQEKQTTSGDGNKPKKIERASTAVDNYINMRLQKKADAETVYENVNKFDDSIFGKISASQWGAIRGIALATKEEEKIEKNIIEYIGHGIKSDDWQGKRADALAKYMKDNIANIREAIVNLASEMAKKSRKE